VFRVFTFTLAVSVAVLLAGCASNSSMNLPPEERVAERAQAHADALMALDYKAAVQFTTPSFQAGPLARRYPSRYAGSRYWEDVEITKVSCEPIEAPDSCVVRSIISSNMPELGGVTPVTRDRTWVEIDGEWFLYEE
jgi:predicted small lipoprotein YifL